MRLWRAFRTMLRTVLHNPGWAMLVVLHSPFRLGKSLIWSGAMALAVGFVLRGMAGGQANRLGYPPGTTLHAVFTALPVVLVCAVLLRRPVWAMMQQFGDAQDDTHGSARFATKREVGHLIKGDTAKTGLLIGRDIKTGKLLRYDGPAHLLTIAPTRTGKGVGTIIPNLAQSPHRSENGQLGERTGNAPLHLTVAN